MTDLTAPRVAAGNAATDTASAYGIESAPVAVPKPAVRGRSRPGPLDGIFVEEIISLPKRVAP